MHRIIAVDDKLGNVRQALQNKGYQVAGLEQNLEDAAVVVVSGMDNNLLGDLSTLTKSRVIDAAGLSANDVVNEVGKALQLE